MTETQSSPLGLDEQAMADVSAEQEYHQQRIADIVAKEAAGTWPYALTDENARHCKFLHRIFLQARKRTLSLQ